MSDHDDDVTIIEKSASISSFLWGALIGAGIMLLYAPRSGVDTRRELSGSFRRMRDTADAALRDMQDSVNETVQEVRESVQSQVDATRSAFTGSRDAAQGVRSDIGQRWEQGRDAVRSAYRPSRPATPSRESEEE